MFFKRDVAKEYYCTYYVRVKKKKKTIIKPIEMYETLFLSCECNSQWYSTGVRQTLVPHFAYPQPFPYVSRLCDEKFCETTQLLECKLKRLGKNIFCE